MADERYRDELLASEAKQWIARIKHICDCDTEELVEMKVYEIWKGCGILKVARGFMVQLPGRLTQPSYFVTRNGYVYVPVHTSTSNEESDFTQCVGFVFDVDLDVSTYCD